MFTQSHICMYADAFLIKVFFSERSILISIQLRTQRNESFRSSEYTKNSFIGIGCLSVVLEIEQQA